MNNDQIIIQESAELEFSMKTLHRAEVLSELSSLLKTYIEKNNLFTSMAGGRRYAQVEAWQFAGAVLQLSSRLVSCEDISEDRACQNDSSRKNIMFKSIVEVIDLRTNQVISRGEAICSNDESRRKKEDAFSLASMSQTRAVGKAYRLFLGFLLKMSGFEATPSEEMSDFVEDTTQSDLREAQAQIKTLTDQLKQVVDESTILAEMYCDESIGLTTEEIILKAGQFKLLNRSKTFKSVFAEKYKAVKAREEQELIQNKISE